MIDGEFTPVAVLELSRVDGNEHVPDTYLNAVLARYDRRDGQGAAITRIAAILGVDAWIILFRWDLTEFWAFNLTERKGWFKNISPENYERWIRRLAPKPPPDG